MKHTLGKLFLFFLFSLLLYSEDFTYHIQTSNTTPYLKEGILFKIKVKQTNHDVVLLFNFDLKKSPHYYFQRVGEKENDAYHNLEITYTYIVYPLTKGKINIAFSLIKKVTTDDQVAYSFSGDRDNVKGLVTQDTTISLPPTPLMVKALPQGTQIVGDFTLTHSFQKAYAQPYEPIAFKMKIEGIGYPPILKHIFAHQDSFKLFKQAPINKTFVTTKGINNHLSYSMALSATKNFSTPPLVVKAFNPRTQKPYELFVPSKDFKIKEVKKASLLDTVDNPLPLRVEWQTIQSFFQYLLVFLAGYFTHFSLKWRRKKHHKKILNPLLDKIDHTKDEKELLQLLLSTQRKEVNSTIVELEEALYQKKKSNLTKLKQELKERLK